MLNTILANFYERDIHNLMEEINCFTDVANIWRTAGSIKNSSGNLALHIIGGTSHIIGHIPGESGYVRNRPEEFTRKGVEKSILIADLGAWIPMIKKIVSNLDMEAKDPIPFDDMETSNGYVLVQLLAHLNYHLGQVNYLRRTLEQ